MDKYKLRTELERDFYEGNRYNFLKKVSPEDFNTVVEVLWEIMLESGDTSLLQKEIQELKSRIKTLDSKSGQRVRCLQVLKDRRALVQLGPLKEEVMISPSVDITKLLSGTEVLLIGGPEGRLIAAIREPSIYDGKITKIQKVLDAKRAIVEENGISAILNIADWVICKEGDEVRYDPEAQMIVEVISTQQSSFTLNDLPQETFDDIKGLEKEKQFLYERVIYPSVYKEKFNKYGIKSVKGAILHGKAGNGKTMIAAGIFNEMAKLKNTKGTGLFIINGPSVLSKWAGQTEATIRKIFKEAREAAKTSGFPSIIFWDEIESITGKRKDTSTYTPEKTVVPTLLAELQGVEKDNDVILIGATNRPDLIDPALMRPGRLGDVILEIPPPEKLAAIEIFNAKFTKEVPISLKPLIENGLVEKLVSHIYDNEKPLAIAKTNGKDIFITRQELVSGAFLANIRDEIIRKACLAEINEQAFIVDNSIVDNIFFSQLGVLDAGVKNGFEFNLADHIIDISLM